MSRLKEEQRINQMSAERELKLMTKVRNLTDALRNVTETIDDALLLDEELAQAWGDLCKAVEYGRKIIKENI